MDLIQQILGPQPPALDPRFYAVPPIAARDDLYDAHVEARAAVAVVPPGQDAAVLQAGSAPPLRRTSERVQRIQAVQARLAAEAATEQARQAQAQAEAAAAAAAQQAALGGVVYTPLGGLVAKLQNKDNIYLEASNTLLPVLLGGFEGPMAATSRVTFDQLFSRRLTDLCSLVYGGILTQKLQARFSRDAAIRDFFELTPPQTQCDRVIGGLQGPIQTHCWICGTRLQQPPCGAQCTQDCEHRADVALAMSTTGLYDSVLHSILARSQRGAEEYMNLLRYEYAWSHALCNRIKKDAHFIVPRVDPGTRLATFDANRAGILAVLGEIFREVPRGYPPPHEAELRGEIERARAVWSGLPGDPVTPIQGNYIQTRPGQIERALKPLTDKLNALRLTPSGICLRFTNGLLLRAIHLAPELTKESIWSNLPPEYQAILSARLAGGRRRTRRRAQSRKGQRGGATLAQKRGVMESVVEYILTTMSLAPLFESLVNLELEVGEKVEIGDLMANMAKAVDAHVVRTLTMLQRINWSLVDYAAQRLTGIELIGYTLFIVFAPGGASALTVNSGSGSASPVSRASSGYGTPVAPGSPVSYGRVGTDPRLLSQTGNQTPPYSSLATVSTPGTPTASNPMSPVSVQRNLTNPGVLRGGSGFKFTMGRRPDWL